MAFTLIRGTFAVVGKHEADPDPCVFLPEADPTSLHRFVEVAGHRVRLTVDPGQLMLREKIKV